MRNQPLLVPVLLLALTMTACFGKEASRPTDPSLSSGPAPVVPSETGGEDSRNPSPSALPKEGVLVKHATLNLVVTDADTVEKKLDDLMRTYGAYVANRQSSARVPTGAALAPSDIQEITLTLKVDAKKFDEFLARVKELGSYTHEEIRIEDVTFAFMDLNARLSNQRRVEQRLVAYLKDPSRDYKLIIEVEKELAVVREKIEQLTAQLRVMENQIAYSTLVLHISVRPEWVPPQDRTFWQETVFAFKKSIDLLLETAGGLFVLGLAALPWLAVAVAGLYLLFLVIRFGKGRKKD